MHCDVRWRYVNKIPTSFRSHTDPLSIPSVTSFRCFVWFEQYCHCSFHRGMSWLKSGALSYPFSREGKWVINDRFNLAKRAELEAVDEYIIQDPSKTTAKIYVGNHGSGKGKKLNFDDGQMAGIRQWIKFRKLQRFSTMRSQMAIEQHPFIQVLLSTPYAPLMDPLWTPCGPLVDPLWTSY